MSDTKIAIDPQFIHFKLVTTQVEMMHVAAVRGICNLEEVGVPAQHEFDDNDNIATHALGYYFDEPISVVRMRFFGDFVKLECACVCSRYRKRPNLPRAIDLVRRFADHQLPQSIFECHQAAGQRGLGDSEGFRGAKQATCAGYRQKAAHFIP